jgi:hypothetical protein
MRCDVIQHDDILVGFHLAGGSARAITGSSIRMLA